MNSQSDILRIRIDGFGDLTDPVRDAAVSALYQTDPRIAECRVDDDLLTVYFQAGSRADDALPRLRRSVEQAISSFRFFKEEIVEEQSGAPTCDQSAFPELVASNQVVLIHPGTPVYQGDFARRLLAADAAFQQLAVERGAVEQLYPSTVPTASLSSNGYLASYPQHAFLVAAFHRDMDSLAKVASLAGRSSVASEAGELLAAADEVLAPTVCYRCFDALRFAPNLARPLSAGKIFTGVANCHRCEDKALEELSRLQTFRMREIIFFGAAKFVDDERGWWMTRFSELLKSWNARFRIVTASDPFFATNAASKRTYQSLKRLKYECQMHLPHSNKWVAVASFNNHEETLVKAYELGTGEATNVHSGCVGVGYDRLLFALMCQFGTESDKWPPAMRTFFGED